MEFITKNFILIRKTNTDGGQAHTITIFGDIDVESGKKILNSIKLKTKITYEKFFLFTAAGHIFIQTHEFDFSELVKDQLNL